MIQLENRILPAAFTSVFADLDHDNILDVVYAALPGAGPQVTIDFSSKEDLSFYASSAEFTGGVHVSIAGNKLVASPVIGGSQVKVFDLDGNLSEAFYAWPCTLDIYTATADLDGDSHHELLAGAGKELKVFSLEGKLLGDFFVGDLNQPIVDAYAAVLHKEMPLNEWLAQHGVISYNVTNPRLLHLAKLELSKLPESVLANLNNFTIVLVEGDGITAYPKLRFLKKQVTSEGLRYEDVVGYAEGTEAVVTMNRYWESGSVSPLLHEIGHLIDNELGLSNESWANIWAVTSWESKFLANSKSEAFAESFARYWNGGANGAVKEYFQELYN